MSGMKKLAVPVLVFALLGIVSLFVPGPHGSLFSIYREFDGPRISLLLLSFGAAAIAAGLSLRAPRSWHGYLALGSFALALVKSRAWTVLQNFGAASTPLKLLAIAIVAGVMFTLLATVLRDEPDAIS